MPETPHRVRKGPRDLRHRRRPPAARRVRPDLDLRRRPADRDPGQGPRPDRPLRLLVHAPRADRAEPHARHPRRRPLDGVPPARDAADRVRRARLSRGLGLEGLPRERRGLRAPAARGPPRVGQAPRADLHAGDEGAGGARREHHARAGCGARRRGAAARGRGGLAPALQDGGRARARARGSSSPTRSSSWASTPTATSCSATRR